jgi:ATP-dependent Clp protease ATP-binding subunit ClpA
MEASMETTHIPLSQDAALVIALAGTAIPFAHSAEDEAERWLRAMRLQGEVGKLLQALGVGEAPLMETPWSDSASGPTDGDTPPLGTEGLERVAQAAERTAMEHEAESVGTEHVLLGVLEVYDKLFEKALYVRGTSREELMEHLGDPHPARSSRTGSRFPRGSR